MVQHLHVKKSKINEKKKTIVVNERN